MADVDDRFTVFAANEQTSAMNSRVTVRYLRRRIQYASGEKLNRGGKSGAIVDGRSHQEDGQKRSLFQKGRPSTVQGCPGPRDKLSKRGGAGVTACQSSVPGWVRRGRDYSALSLR